MKITFWAIEDKDKALRLRYNGVPFMRTSKRGIKKLCDKDERPVKVEIRKVE